MYTSHSLVAIPVVVAYHVISELYLVCYLLQAWDYKESMVISDSHMGFKPMTLQYALGLDALSNEQQRDSGKTCDELEQCETRPIKHCIFILKFLNKITHAIDKNGK